MTKRGKIVWLIAVGFFALFFVVFVVLVVNAITFWSPKYAEGPGTKYAITERQVVQAEWGFDLPPSASTPRLAIYGGKDYTLAGWILADVAELEAELLAQGYTASDAKAFQDMTSLYPQLSWFVLPENEIQSAFRHQGHRGRVLVSTRRDAQGRAEVFMELMLAPRDPLTWQYFE